MLPYLKAVKSNTRHPTRHQNNLPQMDENNSIIYGLESQARSLTPQLAEPKEIRFFIATQTLKPSNQLHLIELNESTSSLSAKIFAHPLGEVWKLNSSPHDPRVIVSTYSCQKGSQVIMQSALLRLPESLENTENKEYLSFENTDILDTQTHGNEIKTTEFHPSDSNKLATVIDGKILLHEVAESKVIVVSTLTGKNSPKYSTGKWSQHHQGNQFVCLYDCGIRSYDIRDPNHCAWQIEDGQFIRDLDCNPNKQCLLVTGGDDGTLKIWDTRNIKEPVFVRSDHSHWIWSVRFNTFHDQLILSSSSDCKVLLTCASSVSSEATDENGEQKEKIPDGLLQTFDGHEDSVYCCEWSSTDPWIFASLSYDGRVIVSKVPKQYKYKILL